MEYCPDKVLLGNCAFVFCFCFYVCGFGHTPHSLCYSSVSLAAFSSNNGCTLVWRENVCVSVLILFFLSSTSAYLSVQESCDQLMPAGDWKVWAVSLLPLLLGKDGVWLPLSFLLPFPISASPLLCSHHPSASFFLLFLTSPCLLFDRHQLWCLPESTDKRKGGRFIRLNITAMITSAPRWKHGLNYNINKLLKMCILDMFKV